MRFQAKAGKKYRALVVDDDRTGLELSTAILTRNGFMVDKAASGSEACLKCRSHAYDLIFMDIEMPGLDGYETVRIIREMKKGSGHAYIIALSGILRDQTQIRQCMEAGMNDCMVKPLDPAFLQQKLLH